MYAANQLKQLSLNLKRILHIIDGLEPGGAERLLCNTVANLPEYEHLIVTVFVSPNLSLLPANARHLSLNAKGKADVLFTGAAYKKALRRYKPAFVHAHLYFGTLVAKAFTPSRIPLLFTQHFEFSKNVSKWYYAFADRLVSTKRQTCVAVSGTVLQDYLRSTGFKGHTQVIGIYIPDHYFTLQAQRPEAGHLKVIALGNIKPIKNQQYLLDAFALMKDLPVSCDVYGEGPEREALEAKARAENIAVHFKGSITDSSLVLPGYDAYVMPSLTEGFPLALFEAMAVGLPPLVSNIPVFHELLGNEGTYLDLRQPASLREAVEDLLAAPQKREAAGQRVKKLSAEKASQAAYLKKVRRLYAACTGAAAPEDALPHPSPA